MQTIALDFEQLSSYQKRRFVPEEANLKDQETVVVLYQKLLDRAISSQEELESWIEHRSELDAALDQAGSILYIRMTCQTDDAKRAEAYKNFIETVIPAIKPLNDQLNRKYLQEQQRFPLNSTRYEVYTRSIQADVDLFVKENVSLQTEVALLSQQYQTVCGAMTVQFQGKERTLSEMGKFLLEPDRDLRESAWYASSQRRLQDQEKLEELFDQMLSQRVSIAQNADCANYCDYQFRAYHRFDYTPEDCRTYHKTVEKLVVPIWRKILKKRQQTMGLEALKPWDTAVDPEGKPPLKPFSHVNDLIAGVEKIFQRLDPELGAQFHGMAESGLLDLASRKGKAPGGYQSALDESRKPFIFMNAVGVNDDINTLLHEGGHAFHALACAQESLVDYRHGPMEFNEVASMGMELLSSEYLDVFYNPEDHKRSRQEHFEGIVHTLAWVATIDAFQQWIYEHPQHTREERVKSWLAILDRFSGGTVDWSGLEDVRSFLWHRQLHIFEVPFYYIEYGIAQLGALQLWVNAQKDSKKALADYRKGLSLGGSRPLPEIYQTAGLKFDFSEQTIAPLMEAVGGEIGA